MIESLEKHCRRQDISTTELLQKERHEQTLLFRSGRPIFEGIYCNTKLRSFLQEIFQWTIFVLPDGYSTSVGPMLLRLNPTKKRAEEI